METTGKFTMTSKKKDTSSIAWQDRIQIDSRVCHGKACIKGTRIMVSIILDYVRAGESHKEILRQYPTLSEADIEAALGYAAWLVREEEQYPLHTEPTP